jgi:hypothetical protein
MRHGSVERKKQIERLRRMVLLRHKFRLLRRVALLVRRHWTLANRVHGQTPMPARVTASHILLVGNHRALDMPL